MIPRIGIRKQPTSTEVSEARWKRFEYDLKGYVKQCQAVTTLDSILTLYGQWMRTGDWRIKLRIVLLLFEMRRLDSAFQCDMRFTPRKETQ